MDKRKEIDSLKNKTPHSWGFLFVGWWVDLFMSTETESEKNQSVIDNNGQQAYQTLVEWVKTVPNAIDEIKKNGTEEDLRKYQLQIKMVLDKLKNIEQELRSD